MNFDDIGDLNFISEIMNAEDYIKTLKENILFSLKCLERRAIFWQDNDPNQSTKKTAEFLKKQKVKMLDLPSVSPDLNPI